VSLVLIALAGIAVGGAIAMYQQKQARWLSLVFLLVGALFVWASYAVRS
jgi:1,4-dihydroxy-2-naphthoate octaprenyltransferase